MRSGLTRGNGISLIVAGLVAALSVTLAGCGGSDQLTSIKRTLENPFRKDEAKLPGERIAVITDPNMIALDPAEAGRPLQLPSPQVNASWSQPGGSPSNSLGHLALGDQPRKVWSADAGTGSSSSGRLSAVPLVADGKVYTLDAGGRVTAFAAASGAKVWSASVTPENEKSREGFGGGLAMDGGHLYARDGLRHGGEPRRKQRLGVVDEAHRQAHPQLADRRRRQDLFRLDRQCSLCAERFRRTAIVDGARLAADRPRCSAM